MAPSVPHLIQRATFNQTETSAELSVQWTHPGDVFSVLLILGGDVVTRTLAQLSGWTIGPPSFSFGKSTAEHSMHLTLLYQSHETTGWVAYSTKALVAAVGENKLMPPPDCSCIVINGKTGYSRANTSWIIGKVVQDYDFWMDKKIHETVERMIEERWALLKERQVKGQTVPTRPTQVGLCISLYEPDPNGKVAAPSDVTLFVLSGLVAVVQLGVAAIPCGITGDWGILLVTAFGILLSSATLTLPQWRAEKWACGNLRKGSSKRVVLTRGNGSQHAIVILGREGFLDLEDLAAGHSNLDVSTSKTTKIAVIFLSILWILLLITASGLRRNTWFLLAVGGIGMLWNIYVAGRANDPASSGLPLKFVDVIANQTAMQALYDAEERFPRLGKSMLPVFFPGSLREDEEEAWKKYDQTEDSLAMKNRKRRSY